MAGKDFFWLCWPLLMSILLRTTVGEKTRNKEGSGSGRCVPVIFHFGDHPVLLYFHTPLQEIRLSQKDIQLRKERTFACGCWDYADDTDANTAVWPKWLQVAQTEQTPSWAISSCWKNDPLQIKQVSYLTVYRSGQYSCGFEDGKQVSIEIVLMPSRFLTPHPIMEACQPEIFLQASSATSVNFDTRPLNSKLIRAVDGRRFQDIRCRCMGASHADQVQLYWERNGIQLTNESYVTTRLFSTQSDGPVISLNITMDSMAYRSTFTCRSGPSKLDRITLEVLSKPMVTEILNRVQTWTVDEEYSVTCVSVGSAARLQFYLTRGNQSRPYLADKSQTSFQTTNGHIYVTKMSISFRPNWTMFGWQLQCRASDTTSTIWKSLVNGVEPANGDQFEQDVTFHPTEQYSTLFSSHPETSSISLKLLDRDAANNSPCSPVILVNDERVNNEVMSIDDKTIIRLRCQCQEEEDTQTGQMPLLWTLRASTSNISQVGSKLRPFTANVTIMADRYDTRPTYFCHGRHAEPASVSFDIRSMVQNVQISSEREGFIKDVWNKVSCSVTAANPAPLFRFIIRYSNGTLEEIANDSISQASLLENPPWAPTLVSTASFEFLAKEDHEAAEIFCLAFQMTDLLLMPHWQTSFWTNASSSAPFNKMASMIVKVIQGRPPVIRRFYSVPSQPVVGEPFSLYCLVQSDAPVWNVHVLFKQNNGDNISFPVLTNQPIISRHAEIEELGAGRHIARLQHHGMYRCQARNTFGAAEEALYHLTIQAPPQLELRYLNQTVISTMYVEAGSYLELNVKVTAYPDWTDLQCWKGQWRNLYESQLTDQSMERLRYQGKATSTGVITIKSFNQTSNLSIITCRASNKIGTSTSTSLELKLDHSRINSLSYEAVSDYRCAGSDMQCPLLVVFSNIDIMFNKSLSGPFKQILRFCPVEPDSLDNLACKEEMIAGNMSQNFNNGNRQFVFDLSDFNVQLYRMEATAMIGQAVYYRSILINRTEILAGISGWSSPLKAVKFTSIPMWASVLMTCVGMTAISAVLVMLCAYQKSKKQNVIVKPVMASKKFLQQGQRKAVSKSSLGKIDILENDPVVVRIPASVSRSRTKTSNESQHSLC